MRAGSSDETVVAPLIAQTLLLQASLAKASGNKCIYYIKYNGNEEIDQEPKKGLQYGADHQDLWIEGAENGAEDYPGTFKEQGPAHGHLHYSYDSNKSLLDRKVEEQNKQKGKEHIKSH